MIFLKAALSLRIVRVSALLSFIGISILGIYWGIHALGLRETRWIPSLPPGTLTIAYSPEKEDLFLNLVLEFNIKRPVEIPPVHAVRVDMVDMLVMAMDGKFGAISPDSSVWLEQLDRMWRKRNLLCKRNLQ